MKLPEKYRGATEGPWTANEGQNGCWFIWNSEGGISTKNLIATFNGRVNADYRDPARAKADAILVKDAPMLACRVAELSELLAKIDGMGCVRMIDPDLADQIDETLAGHQEVQARADEEPAR